MKHIQKGFYLMAFRSPSRIEILMEGCGRGKLFLINSLDRKLTINSSFNYIDAGLETYPCRVALSTLTMATHLKKKTHVPLGYNQFFVILPKHVLSVYIF